ncbi:MAG: PqqD family protein [Proteobacteria bacterium]|nr:PqqD family protein [Pseudomonadota bacterium]
MTARVGDEMVMMDADSGSHIGLTETGARIWDLIEAPMTFGAICSALAEEYDAPAGAIAADIVGFLQQLAARGAISLEPPA